MGKGTFWLAVVASALCWLGVNVSIVWRITQHFTRLTGQEWFWIVGMVGGLHLGVAILVLIDFRRNERRKRQGRAASDVWIDG